MSRRARDVLVGVALTLVALGGAAIQVDASEAHRELPPLICPLH